MKQATLGYLIRKNDGQAEVCLGMKLRGQGMGKYNGFGGKIGDTVKHESIVEALIREGQEEFGITVLNPFECGEIYYRFFIPGQNDPVELLVHIFRCFDWQGTPTKSDEMEPFWFPVNKMPWAKMEANDHLWLPKLLKRNCYLNAKLCFDRRDQQLPSSKIEWK